MELLCSLVFIQTVGRHVTRSPRPPLPFVTFGSAAFGDGAPPNSWLIILQRWNRYCGKGNRRRKKMEIGAQRSTCVLSVDSRQTEACLGTSHRGQTDTTGAHLKWKEKQIRPAKSNDAKACVVLWQKCQSQRQFTTAVGLIDRPSTECHNLKWYFKRHTHTQRQNYYIFFVLRLILTS